VVFAPLINWVRCDLQLQAGTMVRPNIMVASVRILALEVRFRVRNDAKMISTVLRCFPNVRDAPNQGDVTGASVCIHLHHHVDMYLHHS
jgi:hypothetical protein